MLMEIAALRDNCVAERVGSGRDPLRADLTETRRCEEQTKVQEFRGLAHHVRHCNSDVAFSRHRAAWKGGCRQD
jgi:hypothetical protein